MTVPTHDDAVAVLAAQPFGALVGGSITEFERGRAVLEIPVRDELRQQFGLVHGGVLAYAADNTLTFAAGSVLGAAVLTAGFTITYMRPAKGPLLRAVGTVVDAGTRQAVCRCDIFSLDGAGAALLVASAQGTARSIAP
mgnify:CR=1 FL=1